MKVAAYQASLLPIGSPHSRAIELIRERVRRCEVDGVSILCCPEAVLGGLADYAADPGAIAIERGALHNVLAPLASNSVTTIVGFTELADGLFFNSAAVLHRGVVMGIYRKRHPALRRSIYAAGDEAGVFTVGDVVLGILICNDSNYPELARHAAARGATLLVVPTNNALPPERADVVADARRVDTACAIHHRIAVVRADVTGRTDGLVSYGSTGITASDGSLVQTAHALTAEVVVADLRVETAIHT